MHTILFLLLLLNNVIVALAAPAATTTTSANPADCTAAYVTVKGKTGAVQCGVDHPGGDYKSASASSLQACEGLCAADNQCVTAQYIPNSKTCYLKANVHTAQYKASTNGIVFYNASTPAVISPTNNTRGCTTKGPPNPWLINGGFENGLQDVNIGAWGTTDAGANIVNNVAFEGCKSLSVYPTSDPSTERYTSFGIPYSGLQIGSRYNWTITVGRPVPDISNLTAPVIQGIMQDNGQYYYYYWAHLCGYKDTGPCPIVGTGGARGQTGVPQFTASMTSGTIYFKVTWTDASNDVVLFDDFRIQPM